MDLALQNPTPRALPGEPPPTGMDAQVVDLRFFCSPVGSDCRSSKWGPGRMRRTSSMLRQPGRESSWARRTVSGA